MTQSLEFTGVSRKSFDETVAKVEELTAEQGFRVLHVHDIHATLKEKGFPLAPFKIIEICNAKYAHAVLTKNPGIGMMLPCKINVYVDGHNAVVVSGMKPTMITEFFPDTELGPIPGEVEKVIHTIVERATQP